MGIKSEAKLKHKGQQTAEHQINVIKHPKQKVCVKKISILLQLLSVPLGRLLQHISDSKSDKIYKMANLISHMLRYLVKPSNLIKVGALLSLKSCETLD